MSSKLIKVSSDAVRNPQPLCHLNITSDETGAVSAQAVYVGGFDLNIPAHFFLMRLMRLADTLGEREAIAKDEIDQIMEIPKGQVFS